MPVAVASGRAWTTTPGTSLAVSVLVPPSASGPSWVPLFTGLAVHRAVSQVAGVATALKWPNDVLVPADDDRKLAGILCEWTADGVVAGLGLNVDTARADLPLDTATSLRAVGAPGVDRAALLTAYLVHLAGILRDDTGAGGAAPGGVRRRVRHGRPQGRGARARRWGAQRRGDRRRRCGQTDPAVGPRVGCRVRR